VIIEDDFGVGGGLILRSTPATGGNIYGALVHRDIQGMLPKPSALKSQFVHAWFQVGKHKLALIVRTDFQVRRAGKNHPDVGNGKAETVAHRSRNATSVFLRGTTHGHKNQRAANPHSNSSIPSKPTCIATMKIQLEVEWLFRSAVYRCR
jgi:hypothetical protein